MTVIPWDNKDRIRNQRETARQARFLFVRAAFRTNIKILKSSIFFWSSANGGLKLITIWSKLKETDNQVNWV